MRKILIMCCMFLLCAVVAAQAQDISGRLLDARSHEPVAGAVVKTVGGKGFVASKLDGSFKLTGPADSISIRCIGYESVVLPLPLTVGDILMHPDETMLREVTVHSPDIFQRGDTLVFNVGKYATSADNAIIDVIKRLPGVKVESDGTIMYQGKPINKFYIDGNDFIGDSYGLATNNISKNDVAAVEVMENHQPVKALEDIEFSDQAGINLKLKETARSRWVGVANASSGFSPLLYSGSAYSMRLARKMQNMFTVKADNTGWNPDNEIRDHSYEPMFSSEYKPQLWREYISADIIGSPLAENRTRDNLSWLADAIMSWGGGDVSNRLKINYVGDRLDYAESSVTDYLSNDIAAFVQDESLHTRRHTLTVGYKAEINRKRYFLKDNLTLSVNRQHAFSSVTGSMGLHQDVCRQNLAATNDLRLVKKTDNRIFTLSSRNSFSHCPSSLTVSAVYGTPSQNVAVNDFRSTTESQYGWIKGFWRVYVDGGIDLNSHHLNAALTGFPEPYKDKGIYNAFVSAVYAAPKAQYNRRGWRIEASAPVRWHHYSLSGNHDFFTLNPGIYVHRQLTARSEISAGADYSTSAPAPSMFVGCAVLSDYRNLFMSFPVEKSTGVTGVSATYRYRNPLSAFFCNGTAAYTHVHSPYMTNQLFYNDFILTTYSPSATSSDTFLAKAGFSKGLCHSRLVLGVDAAFTTTTSSTMRNNIRQRFRQNTVKANPYLKGSLTRWLSMDYALDMTVNTLKTGGRNASDATSLNHRLSFTFIPTDRLNFSVIAEHYYTHFGDGMAKDANLVLVDASASYQLSSAIRLGLTARNLLDRKQFRYTSFGNLSQTDYSFGIRPRNILMSFQMRF
ncbi:MAG: TonB-dependent receptor [Bacteroidales bacterium]|nr:TonB-dependent receptor [Bacteroidales bacterium]